MDIDQFWSVIERGRGLAGPAADQAVRDYDDPDANPDHDYWDFRDIDLEAAFLADSAPVADPGPVDQAGAPAGAELASAEPGESDESKEFDEDEFDEVSDPVASAVVAVLAELPVTEIASFEMIFDSLDSAADRDDLANAATLISHGFLTEEMFMDFRAGLIALGRATYEAALADPDNLAGHPIVREIAESADPRWLAREDMLFVACQAYQMVTGESEHAFYDYVEQFATPNRDAAAADQQGATMTSKPATSEPAAAGAPEWSITDEELTRQRLPRLAALFYDKSTRNRQRALESLGLST